MSHSSSSQSSSGAPQSASTSVSEATQARVIDLSGRVLMGAVLLWGALLVSVGADVAAMGCFGYLGVAAVARGVWMAGGCSTTSAARIQILLIIVFPTLVQVLLGGFAVSGGMVLWAALGPLAAPIFLPLREWRTWFGVFLLAILVSVAADGLVPASALADFGPVLWVANLLGVTFVARFEVEEFATGLTRALARARQSDRVKATFLASMSHELRTPLNAIVGYGEMLAEDLPAENTYEVRKILASAKRLNQMVDDVLALSELSDDTDAGPECLVDLDGLLQTLQLSAEADARRHGLAIQSQVDTALTGRRLLTHPDRLQRTINRLLAFVVHRADQGRVTLRADRIDGPHRVRLTVTAPGEGLDAARFADLSAPFESTNGESRRSADHGLSLAVACGLAASIGARVDNASDETQIGLALYIRGGLTDSGARSRAA